MTPSSGAPAASSTNTPCDDVSNRGRYVCDPASAGSFFYFCYVSGEAVRQPCPAGLVFSNFQQACDWTSPEYQCSSPTAQSASTTPAPTTSKTTKAATSPTVQTTAAPTAGVRAEGNPCQGLADGTKVCNPANGGESFFTCSSGLVTWETSCPPGLLFDNNLDLCDWAYKNPYCPASSGVTVDGSASPTAAATTPAGGINTATPRPGACSASTCKLPACRCLGTDIPGGLSLSQVPQMVILTFDDDINSINSHYYEGLYPDNATQALKNPNGCRTTGTFYVSNGWTDFKTVASLVSKGNEAASHSKDHSSPSGWDYNAWVNQMEGQRQNLVQETGLPASKFPGMRAPFLELGGDVQFSMLRNYKFTYDSSMLGGSYTDDRTAPVYPFTLDYPPRASTAMCDQGNCPTSSYPGLWEVPIVRQYTPSGTPCSMTDDCGLNGIPSSATKAEVMAYLRHNFNRHFLTNRSPYMISLHATWFTKIPSSYEALRDFLREINAKPEVWQISVVQMLDWMQNPKPLSEASNIPSWKC